MSMNPPLTNKGREKKMKQHSPNTGEKTTLRKDGRKIIVLNKTQMKNKDLVKQFTSGGFKVVESKKVPMKNSSKDREGKKQWEHFTNSYQFPQIIGFLLIAILCYIFSIYYGK